MRRHLPQTHSLIIWQYWSQNNNASENTPPQQAAQRATCDSTSEETVSTQIQPTFLSYYGLSGFSLKNNLGHGVKSLVPPGKKKHWIQSLSSDHGTKAWMWPERFMFLCLQQDRPLPLRFTFSSHSLYLLGHSAAETWFQRHRMQQGSRGST